MENPKLILYMQENTHLKMHYYDYWHIIRINKLKKKESSKYYLLKFMIMYNWMDNKFVFCVERVLKDANPNHHSYRYLLNLIDYESIDHFLNNHTSLYWQLFGTMHRQTLHCKNRKNMIVILRIYIYIYLIREWVIYKICTKQSFRCEDDI